MVGQLLAKVIGTQNDRELKRLRPLVEQINALEPSIQALSDDQLRAQDRRVQGARRQRRDRWTTCCPRRSPSSARPAGACCNMRHYDVQLIGGMVLHTGKIAEMKTGEGKTLVATLPAYLNALEGKGVHVVTVNDYLARRDSEWMGRIYRFLGMTVGVIQHELNDQQRQVAYAADITYGTNNEFGFDYLRDNMKFELASMVQRGHHFAIVDEVDSILIDEARTPLIISGPAEAVDRPLLRGRPHHPEAEKGRGPPGPGQDRGSRSPRSVGRLHGRREAQDRHADRSRHGRRPSSSSRIAWRRAGSTTRPTCRCSTTSTRRCARTSHYQLDVEYMIKDGQVVIVDEFTGRLMPGRRWSDGLHQAVEAKEGVKIERENQTLATITFQNYFRKYKKLSGMTGTAETEAPEFGKIYNLDVMSFRRTGRCAGVEEPDLVYRTEAEKWNAIVEDIIEKQKAGRPALVGTVSIEKSERLSGMLKRKGIKHVVLNAKYHAQEAEIVAQAGRKDGITIATNMAGRGTDILLGGNAEHMARQQAIAEGVAEKLAKGEEKFVDDDEFVYFFMVDSFYRVQARRLGAHLRPLQARSATTSTKKSSRSAACTSSAPSVTRRAASTTSCAAAPAVRATRARRASTCRSKTT